MPALLELLKSNQVDFKKKQRICIAFFLRQVKVSTTKLEIEYAFFSLNVFITNFTLIR